MEALQVCACAAARTRASEGSPTGWCLGRRVPLSVLLHAWQELLSAHRRRRPGLARQTAVFDALDSLVEPVLNRLFMPVQPSGAGTCAGTERDGLGSPTCTCHYARLLARAACQHGWGLPPLSFLSDSLSFFNSSCFSASSWGGYASRRAGSSSSAVACATDPAAS